MPGPPTQSITQLLSAAGRGDEGARERLWAIVYDELHRIAIGQAKHEAPGRTLQPTALVNEAYLRLLGDSGGGWADRRHFFAAAAKIMRRIRIDDARKRKRLKRGGARRPVSLDAASETGLALADLVLWDDDDPAETLALDEALSRLEQIDPRKAEVVMLRFYTGLTRDQIAEMLKIAPRTVDKDWHFARAWLHRELNGDQTDEPRR